MKISIDTKHDSSQEIRKAIKLLQSLIGEEVHTDMPEPKTPEFAPPEGTSVFGALFDNSQPEKLDDEPTKETKLEFY